MRLRPSMVFAMSVVIAAVVAQAAVAADASLVLLPSDVSIPQDGVLVGELILKNVDKRETLSRCTAFTEAFGAIAYEVVRPNGTKDIYWADYSAAIDGWSSFAVHLRPGEYIRHPFCLVRDEHRMIFCETGLYKIRAIFGIHTHIWSEDPQPLVSEWASVAVVRGGHGRASYLKCLGRQQLKQAFIHRACAIRLADHIEEFGDYQREAAKVITHNLTGAMGAMTQRSSRSTEPDLKLGLDVARRFGVAVEMWEYLNDVAAHPGIVRRDGWHVFPVNSYSF